MHKQNCWQYNHCGREPGGANTAQHGICPAAADTMCSGINDGQNAGRACWIVAGTLCGGKVQGSFALKILNCLRCRFYLLVKREQHEQFLDGPSILTFMKKQQTH